MLRVAPTVFIYTDCKLNTKVHIFTWGGLRGGTRLLGHPCHPGRTANVLGAHARIMQFMAVSLNDAYRMRDADEVLHSMILSSVNTTAAAAAAEGDDDASQCDVIAPHPEYLLLVIMGSCSSTTLVS